MRVQRLYDMTCGIKNKRIAALVYKVNKLLINLIYPRAVQLRYGVDESSNVIVSLTSFPGRINTVWITIATLLNQTVKPQKVVLWLADEQFPNGEADLPKKLLELKRYGLTICFCDNLYPHKKYYYTMKENPDATVITVDDDIFYPESLVEELLNLHDAYPNTVCCTWAHEIVLDDGNVRSYKEWRHCISGDGIPSFRIMPVGCGGVLYPPKVLHPEVFNKEVLANTALKTDDLWLKCMSLKMGVPAVRINKPVKIYFSILQTQSVGLHYENVGEDKNDVSFKRILEHYPECLKILQDGEMSNGR